MGLKLVLIRLQSLYYISIFKNVKCKYTNKVFEQQLNIFYCENKSKINNIDLNFAFKVKVLPWPGNV